jgi:hypothetical protein
MPSQLSEPNVVPGLVVPHEEWEQTPASVRALVSRQPEIIGQLVKRVE